MDKKGCFLIKYVLKNEFYSLSQKKLHLDQDQGSLKKNKKKS